MNLKTILVAIILASTTAAGCLETDGEGTQDMSPTSEGTNSPSASGGSPTGTGPSPSPTSSPAANSPPTANLSADATEGQAPLTVNFTADGADDDGDALSWTLDADGDGTTDANGTALPAESDFTYSEAGNYTATLNVTDGIDYATSGVTITVSAPAEPQPPADDDPWATRDANGVCHADGAVEVGPYYWHDRPGEGSPPGSGYLTGGGTWIYEESNGMDGLQIGGPGEIAEYVDCVNPDTLHF